MTPCPRAFRPRVVPRCDNVIRPILSCANALDPLAYAERAPPTTGNRPYSISPYSTVKRCSGKGDTTPTTHSPLQSAGRISGGAARRYHLVAVTPLDLGAMLTADRP
jgi:hypothetical protein